MIDARLEFGGYDFGFWVLTTRNQYTPICFTITGTARGMVAGVA